jgi:ankyrin repeat protein
MIQKKLLSEFNAEPNKPQNGLRDSIVADFFYSARGGSKETSHTLMLQSLLYQALEQEPRMFKLFKIPFRRLLGESTGSVEWSYDELKAILLSLSLGDILDKLCGPGYRVYFLLDAMDESEDQDKDGQQRAEVLSFLSKLCSTNREIIIKIIITSRPTNEIERALKRFHRIELQKENGADIEKVVDAGLRSIWESINESDDDDSDSNFDGDDMPAKEAIQQNDRSSIVVIETKHDITDSTYKKELDFVRTYLIEHAHGVILWVVLILCELLHHVEKGAYSIEEIKEKLKGLPIDLESTYEEIVGRLRRMNTKEEIAQGRLMLTWVSFAKRPLTVMEFRDAIAIPTEPGSISSHEFLSGNRVTVLDNNWALIWRRMLSRCGSLLEVVRPNSESPIKINCKTRNIKPTYIVQLLHQTVKDFLVHNSSAGPLELDQTVGQRLIATALLRYLKFSLPMKNLQKRPIQEWYQKQYEEFVEHLLDRPLLGYVLLSLPRHISDSHVGDTSSELAIFLHQLQEEPEYHAWAFLEDWCRAEHLLQSDPPVVSASAKSFRTTCLMTASQAGHVDMVQVMLEARADVKGKGDDGVPVLHRAAENGHEAVVKLLLDKGAELESKDSIYGGTPLLWAAENGHEAVVKLLLDKGAELEFKDSEYGQTPLLWAAESGHKAVVKLLLEKGAELESKDKSSQTPLLCAAANGREAAVKLLLEKGAKLESKDKYGQTPLSWAAEKGHEAVVKLLLEKSAMLESKDKSGRTPLSWAARNGHKAVVKLLLDKGAKLESKDKYSQTPLSWATANGDEAVVNLLLEMGAELESKDSEYGQTPLSSAAANGREAVVKVLLEKGAELEFKDKYRRTPLSWAARKGHEAVAKLLLEMGAELESKDKYSQTPLLCAARNGHQAVVKLLLEKGAKLESKDSKYGQTPLSCASQNGHETLVKLLLEKGAKLESKDKYGRTPLLWAARKGYEAVLKLLLENGAKLESKGKYGQTLLLWATASGHVAVVKLLLDKGAKLESKDGKYGQTPLSCAAANGREGVVKLLLEMGADLESRDSGHGRTPMSWAVRNGHEAVVKLLLDKGAKLESRDGKYGQRLLLSAAANGHEAVIKLLLEKGVAKL